MSNLNTVPKRNYRHLEQLSTTRLEELLSLSANSLSSPEDEEYIDAIIEAILKRESVDETGRLSDIDAVWTEFQQHYNTKEGEGHSLYSEEEINEIEKSYPSLKQAPRTTPFRRLLRHGLAVAAITGLLFATMMIAQAAGIDVFGALGRWTDETFGFVSTDGENIQDNSRENQSTSNHEYYTDIQAALGECAIDKNLAPTWFPEGYNMSNLEMFNSRMNTTTLCEFDGDDGSFFSMGITRYSSPSYIQSTIFEKDEEDVEIYTSGERTFYIMSNINSTTATWSDGNSLMISIIGDISNANIKSMIDSIGG